MKALFQIIFISLVVSILPSCKKDKVITNSSARLTFSQPGITFDTVFTKIGSTTKIFRVHNPNNGQINISSVSLARGSSSFYRLNVDGYTGPPGTVFSNLSIAAKDSMYVFVQVTINPNYDPSVSPFIYRDSIIFQVNGNTQYFSLQAFGQNAYYHMPNLKLVESNTLALYYDTLPVPINTTDTFKSDKPHLIYGYVLVDSYQKLYIEAGAKIYLHSGGGIWVFQNGTINIAGTPSNTVTFQGDRLEPEYKDVPGQWDRIWINEGGINTINYAVIKNASIGVHVGYAALDGFPITYTPGNPAASLTINNTIIQNCSYTGLLAHGYTVTGGDNVVVNCGQHILEFDYGGSYNFYQCTFANYWNQTNNSQSSNARTTPSFNFNNYFNGTVVAPFSALHFGNCILDGSLTEEFAFDTLSQSGGFVPPYSFDHCALKTALLNSAGPHTTSCQINQPMNFIDTKAYNFDIQNNSAAWNSGIPGANGGYMNDINGHAFNTSTPNIGAYAN